MRTMRRIAIMLGMLSVVLTGCGGGAEVEQQPQQRPDPGSGQYTGPAPKTADIQQYKLALWDNIAQPTRCAGCHTEGKTQPYFARRDDVNLAYAATTGLVDLNDPSKSKLVLKVGGGHNCWLASSAACADTMAQWIKLWGNSSGSSQAEVALVAPPLRDVGASKTLPASDALFAQHLHPLLRQYCVNCHTPSSPQAQSPFFADADVARAYDASQNLINLNELELSRFVARLGREFHNCWSDCSQNAATMKAALSKISEAIPASALDPTLVPSKALRLEDGIVAASGGRHERNQIAFYQFKTGSGSIAYDTSGIEPAANLTLQGDIRWITGWGLQINSGRAQASTLSSAKFHQLIGATGEFAIEAWVVPSNTAQQGPAAIVSYAGSSESRNFTLGQNLYNYTLGLRSSRANNAGMPGIATPDADEVLQATLQHVVVNHDPVNGQRIFVNGEETAARGAPATLSNWDNSFALMIGNEANGNRQWQGSIRLLAIHNKALDKTQIQQNYAVGVGQKFYLLFAIGHLIDTPDSYMLFEVSQFDEYSYLFSQPRLVNLSGKTLASNLLIEGMAIGINGREVVTGQAWIKQRFEIQAGQSLAKPAPLSNLGTIIASEQGTSRDEFFLSFGRIGGKTHVRVQPQYPLQQIQQSSSDYADIGLRPFAAIHASMSQLTGVPQQHAKVATVYQTIARQLPAQDNIDTFISAQQMAITQLGIAYCNAAIEDSSITQRWFGNLDLNQAPAQLFNPSQKTQFIQQLMQQLMPRLTDANLQAAHGADVQTSAPRAAVAAELDALITRLGSCGNQCPTDRSKTIAKAACTAVLASADLLVQ